MLEELFRYIKSKLKGPDPIDPEVLFGEYESPSEAEAIERYIEKEGIRIKFYEKNRGKYKKN